MSASGGVIDSFFISLGFKPETGGLKAFQREAEEAKQSVLSIGTALAAFATGFAVKEIAKIGSDFEQTRIQIAGFFTALGQSQDFNSALSDADEALQMIASAAAKLPGEAEEYQQVFTDTFSFVKGAVGGSLKEMTDFTNTLTAIGKAGRLDAGQIARETDELLSAGKGRAATRNRLWMQLLPLMRHLEGQAKLTSEQFNAMTETKRADLMKQAFAGLKPMLDASANSFDAMWGAMVSGAKKLVRLGTVGLFDRMKKALAGLNAMFFDADFNLTALGEEVVASGKKVVSMIGNVVDFGVAIVKWFGQSAVATKALKYGVAALGVALTGLALSKVTKSVALLFKGIFDLKKLLMGGLFLAIFLVAEDLYVFKKGGDSVTGMIVNKLGPAGEYLTKTVLGGLVGGLLALRFAFVRTAIKAVASWAMILGPLSLVLVGLAALALGIYYAYTHWDKFGAGAKTAITVVTTMLGVLGVALVAFKASAIAASLQIAAGFTLMNMPLILLLLALAAIGVAAYELGSNWDGVVSGMTDVWQAFVDSVKGGANALAESVSFGMWSPFDTGAKRADREIKDLSASTAYYKAQRRKNNPSSLVSEAPAAVNAANASFIPTPMRNPNARREDWNDYQSTEANAPEPTSDERASFTAADEASYQRRRANRAFVDASTGSGLPPGAPYPFAPPYPAPAASMTGAQAGAGVSSSTSYATTTYVTVPAINVTGAASPEATAKAIRAELDRVKRDTDRANRSALHGARNKGAAL